MSSRSTSNREQLSEAVDTAILKVSLISVSIFHLNFNMNAFSVIHVSEHAWNACMTSSKVHPATAAINSCLPQASCAH